MFCPSFEGASHAQAVQILQLCLISVHKLSLSISFKELIISFNILSINIYKYLSITINCLTVSSISGADRVGFISQVLYDRAKMYLAL